MSWIIANDKSQISESLMGEHPIPENFLSNPSLVDFGEDVPLADKLPRWTGEYSPVYIWDAQTQTIKLHPVFQQDQDDRDSAPSDDELKAREVTSVQLLARGILRQTDHADGSDFGELPDRADINVVRNTTEAQTSRNSVTLVRRCLRDIADSTTTFFDDLTIDYIKEMQQSELAPGWPRMPLMAKLYGWDKAMKQLFPGRATYVHPDDRPPPEEPEEETPAEDPPEDPPAEDPPTDDSSDPPADDSSGGGTGGGAA